MVRCDICATSRERKAGDGEKERKRREKQTKSWRCNDWITESPESLGGPLAWPPDIQPRQCVSPSRPLAPRGFLLPRVISTCAACVHQLIHERKRSAPREPIAPCTLASPRDDALCAIYVNCWTRALVLHRLVSPLFRARGTTISDIRHIGTGETSASRVTVIRASPLVSSCFVPTFSYIYSTSAVQLSG